MGEIVLVAVRDMWWELATATDITLAVMTKPGEAKTLQVGESSPHISTMETVDLPRQ